MILSKPRPGIESRSAIITLIDEKDNSDSNRLKNGYQHFTKIFAYDDLLTILKETLESRFTIVK